MLNRGGRGRRLGEGPDARAVDRLGFLGPGCFATMTPDYDSRICFDFLGFSRQNLDLSMGYAA